MSLVWAYLTFMSMTLPDGARLGPYEIVSPLGAGGMGEVYRARDTRLQREVAIKILPPLFVSDEDRRARFEREARLLAALNHPHIGAIYGVEDAGATPALVLELVEGPTLADRLAAGPLPLPEALALARQITDALEAAHDRGIIHRDLKPANIKITPAGVVKVLDFGLAKMTDAATPAEAPTATLDGTRPGAILGTDAYMSPEQARGQDVDKRTDVWAFGGVLYEMLTGRRAFGRETVPDTIAAVVGTTPDWNRLPANTPEPVRHLLRRCFEKDRGRRLRDIGEARIALDEALAALTTRRWAGSRLREIRWRLRRVGAPAAAALLIVMTAALAALLRFGPFGRHGETIEALAVLPFVNVSANTDMAYLSDGITDSLIDDLSQLPALKVMSRNSVLRYRGGDTDARQAGHTLGVRAVLTGKVIQRGDDLTVTAELVDVGDGSHLWGKQYVQKLSDLPAVQARLSRDISENLRLRLSVEDRQRLTKRYGGSAEAYELYLKGRYALNALTEESLKKSREYFEHAIAIDSNYGPAYAGLAEYYAIIAYGTATSPVSPREAFPKAKAAALRAVQLDDSLAEAHASLGFVAMSHEWNWEEAEKEFRRAIARNPNNVNAHHWYSHCLMSMGRFDQSLSESRLALALDPLDAAMNFHLGLHYFHARQYDLAQAQLQRTLEMDRTEGDARAVLGLVYERQGRYQEAVTALEESMDLGGADQRGCLGHVYALWGRREDAQHVLDQLRADSQHRYVSPYSIAQIHAGLGEKDQAFAWLDKAIGERDSNVINLKVDPEFDVLHSDARFAQLLRRIGLKP